MPRSRDGAIRRSPRALKAFGDRHGFDAEGFVVDELLDDGRVHKTSRRCWPHTEAIKAEVAAAETGDDEAPRRAPRRRSIGCWRFSSAVPSRAAGSTMSTRTARRSSTSCRRARSTTSFSQRRRRTASGAGKEGPKSQRPTGNERRGDPAGGDSGRRQGHAAWRDHARHSEADAADRRRSAVPRLSPRDDRTPRLSTTSSCSAAISERFSRRPTTGAGSATPRSGCCANRSRSAPPAR